MQDHKWTQHAQHITFFEVRMKVFTGRENRSDNGVKIVAPVALHSTHDLQTNTEIYAGRGEGQY